jgi:glycosyltransferase involved in cell wall biosynthesis
MIETGGPGGAEQMLLRLTDEYGRRGIPQIVCLRKDGWLAGEVRRRCLFLEILPLGRLPDFSWLKAVARISKKYGVKAIHAHEFAMNVRGAMLGRWLGVPVVATVHGIGYFGDKWARRQAYRLTSRSASLIAVSEDIRNQLVIRGGLNPQRVSVISNGVDVDYFRFNVKKRQYFRQLFDVKDNELLLGTVGSYYPVKGHRYLVEAMRKLVSINPCVKLVMAGQGPLANDLQKQLKDGGIGEYVKVVNYIEDVPGFLSAIDIFVMPSLSEGLPLALLEAGANSRCIVATKVGGIPEIVKNKENGILVPSGDADALTEALMMLFDPILRHRLASNMNLIIKRDWSIQRTADRYLKLLLPEATVQTISKKEYSYNSVIQFQKQILLNLYSQLDPKVI